MQGYRIDALRSYFNGRVHKEDLDGYLELLLKEDKAQKFKYKGYYWWRATTNILRKEK